MAGTLRITRQQLAKFLGNDHDAIRQFETLFSTVADSGSTAVATEPEIVVETAAHEALARIANLEQSLTATEPEIVIETAAHEALARIANLEQSLTATEPEIVIETAAHEALARIANLEQSLNKRKTVTLTLSTATGTVDLGQTFEVLDESASAAGRFRLYRTTAGRDADLARLVTTSAPNNVGLLLDDVFTALGLTVAEDPAPCAAGSDGLCAWSWSGALGSTITLTLLVKEA